MYCKCCGVRQRLFWMFGVGIILLSIGLALLLLWPKFATEIKTQKLVLKKDSEGYENWKETPIPMYLTFYLFNWTNPHEIYNPKVKPHLVEMGPYVYLEKDIKDNITFHENNTVTYYHRRVWHFQPELSNGTEQDVVTAAHAITATVADMVRHRNKYIKKVVNFMLNHEGGMLYTSKTVYEWIFHGFEDRLIDFLKIFNSTKIDIPYTRFAWLADRNNSATYDGLFTINTGVENMNELGSLTLWNGLQQNGFYPAPCGTINGTTDLFPPNLDTNNRITIYATDACRYLNLYPNGTVSRLGLTGTLWEGTEETLDSGENYKSQQCFCNKDVMDKCPLAGVVECKKCRNNAPIYASFPHFYLADNTYINGVTGLSPQRDLHRFSVALEPNLGIPLEISARLQINMMLTPDSELDIYRGIKPVLMPMFWFEQKALLSEALASRTKLALNLDNYGRFAGIALIAVGSIFLVIGIAMIMSHQRSNNQKDDDDEDILTTHVVEPQSTNAIEAATAPSPEAANIDM